MASSGKMANVRIVCAAVKPAKYRKTKEKSVSDPTPENKFCSFTFTVGHPPAAELGSGG